MGQPIVMMPLGNREGGERYKVVSQETCHHRRLANISDGVCR
jgi:hypothetical protein